MHMLYFNHHRVCKFSNMQFQDVRHSALLQSVLRAVDRAKAGCSHWVRCRAAAHVLLRSVLCAPAMLRWSLVTACTHDMAPSSIEMQTMAIRYPDLLCLHHSCYASTTVLLFDMSGCSARSHGAVCPQWEGQIA